MGVTSARGPEGEQGRLRWLPGSPALDADARPPRQLLRAVIDDGVRHGIPARRTWPRTRLALVRLGLSEPALGLMLRMASVRPCAHATRVVDLVGRRWEDVRRGRGDLPITSPVRSTLTLHRGGVALTFLFGDEGVPVVLAKTPAPRADGVIREHAALRRLEASGVTPRPLAVLEGVHFQDALPGRSLPVPLVRGNGMPAWTSALAQAATASTKVAEATVRRGHSAELEVPLAWVERAELPANVRRRVEAAVHDVRRFDRTVLRHGDLSPENVLWCDARVTGIVDWTDVEFAGIPGFDVLHFAVTALETSVGMAAWSERVVTDAFQRAWTGRYGDAARAATATALEAVGLDPRNVESTEAAFFARRLGRRLRRPDTYAVGPRPAARMLEMVCDR